MIEIKKSPIHGLGVFATEFIPKGTNITKYNQDRVYQKDNLPSGEYVTRKELDYIIETGENEIVVPNIELRDVKECGQLINDAADIESISASRDTEKHIEGLVKYYRSKNFNARLGKDIIAVRDIEPGEEILTLYGYAYWVTRAMKTIAIPTWEISFISNLLKEHAITKTVCEMKNETDVVAFIRCCLAYGKQVQPTKKNTLQVS